MVSGSTRSGRAPIDPRVAVYPTAEAPERSLACSLESRAGCAPRLNGVDLIAVPEQQDADPAHRHLLPHACRHGQAAGFEARRSAVKQCIEISTVQMWSAPLGRSSGARTGTQLPPLCAGADTRGRVSSAQDRNCVMAQEGPHNFREGEGGRARGNFRPPHTCRCLLGSALQP